MEIETSRKFSEPDSWEGSKIFVDGVEHLPGSPIALKAPEAHVLKIVSNLLDGKQIRLEVVDVELANIDIAPKGWVTVSGGIAEFTITPQSIIGKATLILFAMDFTEVLTFPCIVTPPPHPWYSVSSIYVESSSWSGFVPHAGLVPGVKAGSSFKITLKPVGDSLLGKQVEMKTLDSWLPPVVTPTEPQVMVKDGITWRVVFTTPAFVTARIFSPDVPSWTGITFVPSGYKVGIASSEE